MRLSRIVLPLCLALAGSLSLAGNASAVPAPAAPGQATAPSGSGSLLVNGGPDGEEGTYRMDPADGSLIEKIARGSHADYAPTGSHVAYSYDADPCVPEMESCRKHPDLWISTAGGSKNRLVARAAEGGMGQITDPDWSPDGSRILFGDESGTSWVRPDGSGRELLPGVGAEAVFSPDGTRIASLRTVTRPDYDEEDIGQEILLTDVVTRETRVIATDWNAWGNGLDWSPDGLHLTYGGEYGLRIVDVLTGEHREIQGASGSEVRTPVFSPDGSRIAFSGWDWETFGSRIFVVNTDGTGLRTAAERGGELTDWVG